MALILKIADIVKDSGTSHEKLLTTILQNMKKYGGRKAYSDYAPDLNFSSPASRRAIGNALFDLWKYCVREEIPLLNMLVVLKDKQLPSTGIERWYEDKFNTLAKYDEFCRLQAELAEFILKNEIIKIE